MLTDTNHHLVFDFGRVLVDFDFRRAFEYWARFSKLSVQQIEDAFSQDEAYYAHERGELTWHEYARHLRQTCGIAINDDSLLEGWNAIFLEPLTGIEDTLSHLANFSPLYVLSNTNAAHYTYWASHYVRLLSHFKEVYCSHQLSARKPESTIYQAMLSRIGTTADTVTFFDDVQANVDGAKSVGIEAFCVTSTQQVREFLSTFHNYNFVDTVPYITRQEDTHA